ncbi:MAG: hypothetical protein IPI93_15340 [Sphingobacteriaceae bacterium]|nr:hypothetical protein [Sphingobacteriaceae bacterium]MBK7312111.1 hypothetical protein [Sphingobacteriaceae bacterium]
MIKKNKVMLIFISVLISIAAFILLFAITYNVACMISPPYFEDEKGQRFAVMPMGQAFLGIILATIGSIVSLIMCYKKLKKKWN